MSLAVASTHDDRQPRSSDDFPCRDKKLLNRELKTDDFRRRHQRKSQAIL
jgi:hypothetical protein